MGCAGGLTAELRTPGFHCGRNNAIPGVLHVHRSGDPTQQGHGSAGDGAHGEGRRQVSIAPPPGWDVFSIEPAFACETHVFGARPPGRAEARPFPSRR